MLKEIPGYENYLINEAGVVISKKEKMMCRTAVDNDGYMYVYLDNRIEYIHTLVAETFLAKEKNLYPVHIDNDPLNNHVTNIKYSDKPDDSVIVSREHREYSGSSNEYEVFSEETGDSIICIGRGELARTIQYEEISLKNMVGNGRKIFLGPYKGYKIRRNW